MRKIVLNYKHTIYHKKHFINSYICKFFNHILSYFILGRGEFKHIYSHQGSLRLRESGRHCNKWSSFLMKCTKSQRMHLRNIYVLDTQCTFPIFSALTKYEESCRTMYRELEQQRLSNWADKFVFDRRFQCLCLNVKTEIIQVVCIISLQLFLEVTFYLFHWLSYTNLISCMINTSHTLFDIRTCWIL